jgi:isoprenylcysteine carboxyl methyltransferase (ICMT) family protein YpbQ
MPNHDLRTILPTVANVGTIRIVSVRVAVMNSKQIKAKAGVLRGMGTFTTIVGLRFPNPLLKCRAPSVLNNASNNSTTWGSIALRPALI